MKKNLSIGMSVILLLTLTLALLSCHANSETEVAIIFWHRQRYISTGQTIERQDTMVEDGAVKQSVTELPSEHGEAINLAVGDQVSIDPSDELYLYVGDDPVRIFIQAEAAAPSLIINGVSYTEVLTDWNNFAFHRSWRELPETDSSFYLQEDGDRTRLYLRSDIPGLRNSDPVYFAEIEVEGIEQLSLIPAVDQSLVAPWVFLDGRKLVSNGYSSRLPEGYEQYAVLEHEVTGTFEAREGSSNFFSEGAAVYTSAGEPGRYYVEQGDGFYQLFSDPELNDAFIYVNGKLYLTLHAHNEASSWTNPLSYYQTSLPDDFERLDASVRLQVGDWYSPPSNGVYHPYERMDGLVAYQSPNSEIVLAKGEGLYGGGYEIFIPADLFGYAGK